jgi:hypothetical protein
MKNYRRSVPKGGAMEKKEDVILECFVLKGEGVDWLAVIYLEKETTLMAFSRKKIMDRSFQIQFLTGTDQQRLSEELSTQFDEVARRCGLPAIHLDYPRGVKEEAFVQGLQKAKIEWNTEQERRKN